MRLDQVLPPPELMGHASGVLDADDFRATGAEFLGYFRDFANLQPNAKVLDLGCGCGRIALALAGYLDRTGSYDGIDVDSKSIDWANEEIGGRCPNFRFQRADVFNTTYNPEGKVPPQRYRLPFDERTFDFAFLASVFTHMLPGGMSNYLSEVARVLKVKGKCLITMFLLNDGSAARIAAGHADFQFPHRLGDCCVANVEKPEDVVSYDEPAVLRKFESQGLKMLRKPVYGRWSGHPDAMSYQDLLIAQKSRHVGVLGWTLRLFRPTPSDDQPQFTPEPALIRRAA